MATTTDLHLLRCLPWSSPVRRMWAGTKLIITAAIGIAVVWKPTWPAIGITAALVLLGMVAARYPPGALPRLPRWFVMLLGYGAVVALVGGGAPYVHIGGVSIGLSGLFEWAQFTALGLVVVLGAVLLGATTPVADLPGAVDRLCTPLRWVRFPVDEFVAAFTLVVRAFPLILDEIRILYAAWRLRRPVFAADGAVIRELHDALTTAVAASLRRARDLARAIEARGGIGPVPPPPLRLGLRDAIAVLVTAGAIVAILLV
jgi:energy-coupling factor transport system permease protein